MKLYFSLSEHYPVIGLSDKKEKSSEGQIELSESEYAEWEKAIAAYWGLNDRLCERARKAK